MGKNSNTYKPKSDKFEQGRGTRKSGTTRRSRGGRPKKEDQEQDKVVKTSSTINDASYYVGDEPNLMNQLNNYSFTQFLGEDFYLNGHRVDVSTIMQICLNPSINHVEKGGTSLGIVDGTNIVGLRNYTILSAENAKSTNYAPQDVTILMLAVGSLLSAFSAGARAFGLVPLYNTRNRSYPATLVRSCGFLLQDVVDNFAQYRNQYNYIVSKFNKIPIPADIRYFKKCSELYQGIYLDEENSDMAQTYCFAPNSYWILDETTDPNGSMLREIKPANQQIDPDGLTYVPFMSGYLNTLNAMVDALLMSSTLNYIYSDILRLHNKANMPLLTLSEIPSGYIVLPQKVEEISMWINNATVLGEPDATAIDAFHTAGNSVYSNPGANSLAYAPSFQNVSEGYTYTPLVNFKHSEPSVEDKILSTRLTVPLHPVYDSSSTYLGSDSFPADTYVVRINMVSNSGGVHDDFTSSWFRTSGSTFSGPFFSLLSKFDWHPMVYLETTSGQSSSQTAAGSLLTFGDLQFFTEVSGDILKRMNDVAMMKLLELR